MSVLSYRAFNIYYPKCSRMIITIDGPAGTGKSTVAKRVAEELQFEYLDTGAMYRMIAIQAVASQTKLTDEKLVSQIAEKAKLDFQQGAAILNGRDVSDQLRTQEVSLAASVVAQNEHVRSLLVERQRQLAEERNIVCEGRDQGTVVFPHAELKIFLTADPEVRAKRRLEDLRAQGKEVAFDQLLEEQTERDQRDETRTVAPLVPAADAIQIDSTKMAIEDVVQQIAEEALARG